MWQREGRGNRALVTFTQIISQAVFKLDYLIVTQKFFITPCCGPPAMIDWLEHTELDILADVRKDGTFIEMKLSKL